MEPVERLRDALETLASFQPRRGELQANLVSLIQFRAAVFEVPGLVIRAVVVVMHKYPLVGEPGGNLPRARARA
eukprot:7386128-Prymnesium_polylepis.2